VGPVGTPLLIGLALGVYGITQAILQVPFGRASDRFGRKPVITVGLLLLAVGSVVAALATSVLGVIVGRAIQGCGAVAAAIMALSTDLTREENRAKAMATIGISIGTSVMLAFMVAPALAASMGVTGIFWLIAVLALVAIVLVWQVVPPEPVASQKLPPAPEALRRALSNPHIITVLLGIFSIHALLMALFVSVPVLLIERLHLPLADHWKIYVPTLLAAGCRWSFNGERPGIALHIDSRRRAYRVRICADERARWWLVDTGARYVAIFLRV